MGGWNNYHNAPNLWMGGLRGACVKEQYEGEICDNLLKKPDQALIVTQVLHMEIAINCSTHKT